MHPLERMPARLINTGQKVVYGICFFKNGELLYADIDGEIEMKYIGEIWGKYTFGFEREENGGLLLSKFFDIYF